MKFTSAFYCLFALSIFSLFSFTSNKTVKKSKPGSDTALKVYKDPQVKAFFKRETGWIAADGAYSIPLGNGKVLWTFGDSYTNDYDKATGTVPCIFNVRNCLMLQPYNNWDWHKTSTILGPGNTTLFRSNTEDGHFNWSECGFAVKDTAYVFCFNLKNATTGLGFASAGRDVFAKVKIPEMKVVGYHTLPDFNGINFALGFVENDKDGYVYVYGEKGIPFVKNNIYVARFPINNPNANWKYWDGRGWNDDIKTLVIIGNAPASGVNVTKVKNKYLLVTTAYSLGCDAGKNIWTQTGNSPTGPFSKPKLIFTIDDTVNGHYPFFYLALSHPEYINNKNELLITYCINGYGKCVPDCVNNKYNPDYYRPRGIRVPLKLIDPTF